MRSFPRKNRAAQPTQKQTVQTPQQQGFRAICALASNQSLEEARQKGYALLAQTKDPALTASLETLLGQINIELILSEREREILRLIVEGKRISEIAEQPIPIDTIRETIRHVFSIADVSDRSIGKVLGTLDHQGFILTTRDGAQRILTVTLTDTGRERIQTHVRASARLKKIEEVETPPLLAQPDRISVAKEQLNQEAADLDKQIQHEEEQLSGLKRLRDKILGALKSLEG